MCLSRNKSRLDINGRFQNAFTLGLELGRVGGEGVLHVIDNYPDIEYQNQIGAATYTQKESHEGTLDLNQSVSAILRQYRSTKMAQRMPFFNKYLCPINLRPSNDNIQIKNGFAQVGNEMYVAVGDNGSQMKFSHFRWTKKQPILSVNQIQLSSFTSKSSPQLPNRAAPTATDGLNNKERIRLLKKRKKNKRN